MKVFVRRSDLNSAAPRIVASYPDNTDVMDDAYGEGITVLNLPPNVLLADGGLGMVLAQDWRQHAGTLPVKTEAKRRIERVFTISDQLNALHEIIAIMMQHGSDPSQWPDQTKARSAALEELWNYIDEVRERARAHASAIPYDPSSDKVWPPRPAKK
jgi:hypothetical protein